jgi:hypothetical protein
MRLANQASVENVDTVLLVGSSRSRALNGSRHPSQDRKRVRNPGRFRAHLRYRHVPERLPAGAAIEEGSLRRLQFDPPEEVGGVQHRGVWAVDDATWSGNPARATAKSHNGALPHRASSPGRN